MADDPSRRDRRPGLARLAPGLAARLGPGRLRRGDAHRADGRARPAAAATPTPVVVDGSSTVFRISTGGPGGLRQGRRRRSTSSSATTGPAAASAKYLQDEVDIVDASRPAKPEEEAKAKDAGARLDPVPRRLRRDHRRRQPEERLRQGADASTSSRSSGSPDSKVKTWKDLDPVLARPGDQALQPGQGLGHLRVLHRGDRRQGQEPARRTSRPAPTTTSWSRASRATPTASATSATPTTRPTPRPSGPSPIKKDKDAPAVEPSPETILDKTYAPLSRPLFIYVKKSAMRRPGGRRRSSSTTSRTSPTWPTKAGYVAADGRGHRGEQGGPGRGRRPPESA